GTFAIDGASSTGRAPFGSAAVFRFDANGGIVSSSVLDATGYCEMRDVTMSGDDAIVTGFTIGVSQDPTYGACSVVTNKQDPVAVRVDRAGAQTLVAHWTTTGTANAQGWSGGVFVDGSVAMA